MIAVTGATGHLGQLVIYELLQRGAQPKDIVALVRDPNKAQNLVSKGVQVRAANYGAPETLEKAFQGVDKVLLISGNEVGQRLPQHTNVVNAAKKVGVKFIAYTSILRADSSKMILAGEHLATEKVIQASGIPYAFLRNSWYIENYTEQFGNVLASGAILGAAKNGKISAATRSDYAAAAAAVLLGDQHAGKVYELAGSAFTLSELAKLTSEVSGKKIEYKDMPAAEYEKTLVSFGVPAGFAHVLADSDEGIVRGDLYGETKDLEKLIGRPLTSLQSAVKLAVK
jgi:NAD(P)H dehydrogenase (quinone)